jgi:hypothetical protein
MLYPNTERIVIMSYQMDHHEQRSQPRVTVEFPVTVSVGSQITVKGMLKDLSLSSAFIRIKNNIYVSINDEIGIVIQLTSSEETDLIQGTARISRMVPGEGFAVYFTKIDDDSMKNIKKILQKSGL